MSASASAAGARHTAAPGAGAGAEARAGSIGAGSDTTPKCIVRTEPAQLCAGASVALALQTGGAAVRYRPAAPPPLRGSKAPFRSPGAIVIAPTAPSDGTSFSR
jgi:hypothetical protein